MTLGLALRTGLREIVTNKFRSALSFSAVSIGVASLLYTFAQTHGMKEADRKASELMGPGRMTIEAKEGFQSKGLSPGLTSDDAVEIRRELPWLRMVYPRAVSWGEMLRYGAFKVDDAKLLATTPEWRLRDWVYERRGRFLNERDLTQAARVCVLVQPGGWDEKPFWASWMPERPIEAFLKRHDLLGKTVLLGDRAFTVVGVIKEPPMDKDPRWDREWGGGGTVIVPITTYQRALLRSRGDSRSPLAVEKIEVDTGDPATVNEAKRRITAILKRRHRGEEDSKITDVREVIQGQLNETRQYAMAAMALGAVAILAGGIGIMNVTLATIFARTKEIGIRRALGAAKGDIMAQFMVEAMLLGVCGGVAGSGLGVAGISYLARHSDRDIASLTWYHLLGALAVAAATGLAFSLMPAWRAAALDPVEALRSEA